MKRWFTSVAALLFLQISVFAQQNPDWGWVRQHGGVGNEVAEFIETDENGNVYTFFQTYDSLSIGNVKYDRPDSYDGWDYILVKHDRNGNVVFSQPVYGHAAYGEVKVNAMAIDADENVYLVGDFTDSLSIDGLHMTGGSSVYDWESFIAKLDRNGDIIWLRKLGGFLEDYLGDIAVDKQGNIIVSGYFYDYSRTYGPFTVTSLYRDNNFILAKLDSMGQYIWVKHSLVGSVEGKGQPSSFRNRVRLAVDRSNNIYVGGRVNASVSFDGINYQIPGGSNMYLAKFAPSGNFVWSQAAWPGYSDVMDMAIDNDDHIYLTGRYRGDSLIFNNGDTLRSADFYAYYLVKYDSSGQSQWVRGYNTPSRMQYRLGLDADANGHCYLSGDIGYPWTYGDDTIVSSPLHYGQVVLKFDRNGDTVWTRHITLPDPADVACDKQGNIYVAGHFGQYAIIGDSMYAAIPKFYADFYVAQLKVPELITMNGNDKTSYCEGDSITVYFSNVDTAFGGSNVFRFEISDKYGSFKNPVVLGTRTGAAPVDSARFALPVQAAAGPAYKVRVVSMSPVFYSWAGAAFTIYPLPAKPVINASASQLSTASVGDLQWYKNGIAIAGATSQVFQPTSSGNYTVSLKNTAGCMATSDPQWFVAVNVDDVAEGNIRLYPNPVTDKLVIENIVPGTIVRLTDVKGSSVFMGTTEGGRYIINTTQLMPGIHILHLVLPDGTQEQYKVAK